MKKGIIFLFSTILLIYGCSQIDCFCTQDIREICHPQTEEIKKIPSTCNCGESNDYTKLKNEGWIECGSMECIEEGELIPYPDLDDPTFKYLKCCEGLDEIRPAIEFDEECNHKGVTGGPSALCTKCGDNICSEKETKCNCPQDCN